MLEDRHAPAAVAAEAGDQRHATVARSDVAEVTAQLRSDALEERREIWSDWAYFSNTGARNGARVRG
jgi:hypothetical protein